jgi:hypothetical protein
VNKVRRTSAVGQEGVICRSVDGKFFFRVYTKDFEFDDYEILHSDLRVRILDHDADFVEDGKDRYLDHSKNTLGLK